MTPLRAPSFGCTLPIAGPSAGPDTLVSLALNAERLGFDSVWVSDHLVIPAGIDSAYPYSTDRAFSVTPETPYLESLTTLAYLAGCTTRIRLGTSVLILPYRNPIVTAKAIATLDTLSRGRVELGIGVGWMREEFEALGYTYFDRRGAVTDEQLRVMKALWSEDLPSFEGQFYRFSPLGARPRPVQQPHPPIWVGGESRRAISRAARLADGWMPIGGRPPTDLPPEEMGAHIETLRAEAVRVGRDPGAITIALSANVGFDSPERPFRGSPARVAHDIQRYVDVGVERFVLGFGPATPAELEERMQRFTEQVVPVLSSTSPGLTVR